MSGDIGGRVRRLRIDRGLQSKDLAEAIGLSASAMSEIESGKRLVKAMELARIAEALGLSPLALLEPDSVAGKLAVAARDPNEVGRDSKILRHIQWLGDLHAVIGKFVSRPHVDLDLPKADIQDDLFGSAGRLARAADAVLGDWRGSEDKFESLANAIEDAFGIDVLALNADPDDLLGAAVTTDEMPLIVINSSSLRSRAMFTLAHELGHALSATGASVITDIGPGAASTDAERFANAFAAELLMPRDLVLQIAGETRNAVRVLERLGKQSGASWDAMVNRLNNLGLIDARQRDELKRRGARGVQADAEEAGFAVQIVEASKSIAARPSRWLASAALRAAVAGEVTVGVLAAVLGTDDTSASQLVQAVQETRAAATTEVEIDDPTTARELEQDVVFA